MAIRTNFIEYGWETSTARFESGSRYTAPIKMISVPETSSRTFRDVSMIYHVRNVGEPGTLLGSTSMSIQIVGQPTSSTIISAFTSNTREQHSWTMFYDATAYFNTYFTGSNHVVSLSALTTDAATIGGTFKLQCTYAFDDVSVNTSIKTVRLPINTCTASFLGLAMYLGNYTASIPALDTYLPESSKVYRDIFVEYHANDAAITITNFNLKTKIDTAAFTDRYTVSQSLVSAPYYYDIQNLSGSISTATTHSIQVSSSSTNRLTGLCGLLHCTYEYDYTGSSRFINSLILSGPTPSVYFPVDLISFFRKTVYIPESNVSLARSGVLLFNSLTAASNIQVSSTSGSFSQYALLAGTVQTGFIPIMYQLDGVGNSNSVPISLSSGFNNIDIYWSHAATGSVGNSTYSPLGGLLYLNYYCDSSSLRPLSNLHTTHYTALSSRKLSATAPLGYTEYTTTTSITESKYYVCDIMNRYHIIFAKNTNVPIFDIAEFACFYSRSAAYNITNPIKSGYIAQSNSGRANYMTYTFGMTPYISKYPEYRLSVYTPALELAYPIRYAFKNYIQNINQVPIISHEIYQTYHSMTFNVTGSVANYSGSGGGIPLTVYNYSTGEKLFSTQSKSGGLIDTYWYDRHTNLMIVAETGSWYVSNILPAGSGSYLITIPTAGVASGEKSFTFIG